ncbi:MAG: PaaI family thioesterase [Acidimicrobiia bacterium]
MADSSADATPDEDHGTDRRVPAWAAPGGSGYVPDADGYYPPHRDDCFGCGPTNDAGLQIKVSADPDWVGDGVGLVCRYRFPERFVGGPGVVHGGAISAVLDDVLGTVPMANGAMCVTGRLTVTYRRPVLVGHEVVIRAWLDGRRGRKLTVKGEMYDSLDRVLAQGEATMIEIVEGHFNRVAADLPPEEVPDDFKPFMAGENYP